MAMFAAGGARADGLTVTERGNRQDPRPETYQGKIILTYFLKGGDDAVDLGTMTVRLFGLPSTDITRDVIELNSIRQGKGNDPCGATLGAGKTCGVSVWFTVNDTDDLDADTKVDTGVWFARLNVPWSIPGGASGVVMTTDTILVVKDDPVPEPSTWVMMLLGLGGVGAGLRRRLAAG